MLRWRLISAFTGALLCALLVSSAQAADAVQVRGGEHAEGYARIAVEWPSPVKFDAQLANETLTIKFVRPFTAQLSALLGELQHYVASVMQSADGTSIVAKLKKPVEIKMTTVNKTIAAIDLVAKSPVPQAKNAAVPAAAKADQAKIAKEKAANTKSDGIKQESKADSAKKPEPIKAGPPRQAMTEALSDALQPAVGAPINLLTPAPIASSLAQEMSKPPSPSPEVMSVAADKQAAEAVQVRGAEHGETFARVAVEWPSPVTFEATIEGKTLVVKFARPFTAKLAPLAKQLDHYVESVEQGNDGKTIIAKLKRPVEIKTTTVNGTIASIDLIARAMAAPDKTAPKTASAKTAELATPTRKPDVRKKEAKASAPKLEPPKPESVKEVAAIVPPAIKSPAAASMPAPVGASPPSIAADPSSPATTAGRSGNRGPEGQKPALTPVLILDNDRASIRFDWPAPTGAVIYRRGAAIWVVFSTPSTLDLSGVRGRGQPMLQTIDDVGAEGATALRLVTADGINPSVRRAGASWIIDLKRQRVAPDTPIVVDPRYGANTSSVELHVREAAAPLRLRDPILGDTLMIVPIGEIGRGINTTHDFVDFRLLPSVQGIVIRPNSDDLRIRSEADTVHITRPQGLVLSDERDRLLGRAIPKAHRLFDFAGWSGPRIQSFADRRVALERAITTAAPGGRTRPRLELARFFFANLLAPEALSVMAQITRDDPKAASEAGFRSLKGGACLLAGFDDCAAQEFGQSNLDEEPEAALWRASLAATKGDGPAAVQQFLRGANLLSAYPKALRNRFALQAAETFIDGDMASAAVPLLTLVLDDRPERAEQAMGLYLRGRVQQELGELDRAIALWDKAIAMDDRKARSRALYARAIASYEAKKASRAETIKALEAMRFAWRGDNFEFTLLRRLGELKLADKDPEGGLDTLHLAASYFPDLPMAKEVTKEAADSFADLFIGKAAEDLSPVKALAVYDAYQDLEPEGDRHDAIVKKLVDRLVSVDLLDRAAVLLEKQIKTRLAGLDKARSATQLALLRLMDHQPDAAIAALDIDVAAGLTPELTRQRQELKARALLDLNRAPEALTMLANDNSRDAYRLRADIYWRQHDWKNAARIFSQLAGSPPADGSLEPDPSRLVLSWAAALTLDGDQAGITRLRQDYGRAMAGTPVADAFNIITGDAGAAAAGGGSPTEIAERVAQIGMLQNFMTAYKQRLANDKLSAIN